MNKGELSAQSYAAIGILHDDYNLEPKELASIVLSNSKEDLKEFLNQKIYEKILLVGLNTLPLGIKEVK